MAGVVAVGAPIEPIPQTERVEVPKSMVGRGNTFALRVKGHSMRDEATRRSQPVHLGRGGGESAGCVGTRVG